MYICESALPLQKSQPPSMQRGVFVGYFMILAQIMSANLCKYPRHTENLNLILLYAILYNIDVHIVLLTARASMSATRFNRAPRIQPTHVIIERLGFAVYSETKNEFCKRYVVDARISRNNRMGGARGICRIRGTVGINYISGISGMSGLG